MCHRCDNPPCCNPDHLFLGSQKDNGQDMSRKRRGTHGERNRHARLTAAEVNAIRNSRETGVALSRRYAISQQTICDIRKGRSWRHLLHPDYGRTAS